MADPDASDFPQLPLEAVFRRVFGRPPEVRAVAPGRVNLIGEHTDYNDGLVLPAAIARSVEIAAAPTGADVIRLYSVLYDEGAEIPLVAPAAPGLPAWARYPQGVAVALAARGVALRGVDAVVGGSLPVGAGLSSSAALEAAASLVIEYAAGAALAPPERIQVCHDAETSFVGVPCGILDQCACILARAGHALLLDCRSRETHHIPLPPEVIIGVCDTGVHRALGRSAYAERRAQCAEALRVLQQQGLRLRSLRDLTLEEVDRLDGLPPPLARRVRHVVTENARVRQAARLLEGGDLRGLREIFAASHLSLRDDYEVGAPELDAMQEAALAAPGCLAARMTGAGFGGAVVALVRRADAEAFVRTVDEGYRARGGQPGLLFTSKAASGAALRGSLTGPPR